MSERLRLWLERSGDGYRIRDAATGDLVRASDPRVRVIKVAGVSYRLDALQDDAFAPGSKLALIAEPENEHDPHAIGVWDEGRRLQASTCRVRSAHGSGRWYRPRHSEASGCASTASPPSLRRCTPKSRSGYAAGSPRVGGCGG